MLESAFRGVAGNVPTFAAPLVAAGGRRDVADSFLVGVIQESAGVTVSSDNFPPNTASITFLSGPLAGQTISISKAETTLGRDAGNDIVIADDGKVSRHHLRIHWREGGWHIENLSRTNSLRIDGQVAQQAPLQHQATIRIGEDTSFRFDFQIASPSDAEETLTLAMSSPPAASPEPDLSEETITLPAPPLAPDQTLPNPAVLIAGSPSSTLPAAAVSAAVAPLPAPLVPPDYDTETISLEFAVAPPADETRPYPPPSTLAPPEEATLPYPLAAPPSVGVPRVGIPQGASMAAAPLPAALPHIPEAEGTVINRPSATIVAAFGAVGLPSIEVNMMTTGQRTTHTLNKPVFNVGRDSSNDIVIADAAVAGQHLQILREGQQTILIHPHPARQSTLSGLLYAGNQIGGSQSYRRVLLNGDVFRIVDERGSLITLTYHDGSGAQQEAVPPVRPIRLGDAQLTIGRKPGNTVVLAHPQVSGQHARLVREGSTYRIQDLNSTNHVYVNAQQVTNHLLKHGDEIRIGPYRLVYESTQLSQYDESQHIRVDALNLFKYGSHQATLLNDISLSLPARSFVAVVGVSGAGKTTLLDALSGLRPAEKGKVLYNGQDYYRNLAAFTTQIGYVPQEDIVHRELTVERALYYAAKIRLPDDFTDGQIWQRISEVLEDVELTERRKHLIKKLSGGQRKRVSIALELLANPSLFFLDEPTSGLDPGLDRKMMVLLRKLADKGHTIVLVTHATNNINVCDYVCFLTQGGRLAYFGSPEGAKAYFGQTEFAEIYTSLDPTDERPGVAQEAEARFKASRDYQQTIAQPLHEAAALNATTGQLAARTVQRAKRGNPFKQFAILSRRHLELLRNDVPTLLVFLLQAPLTALLLILLFRFEVGAGLFHGNTMIQCVPQIRTSAGVLALPSVPNQATLVTCDQVQAFLSNNPQGQAYALERGGVNQALQDFIVAGQGGAAQLAIFMLSLIMVIFGLINASREIVKERAIYRRERAVNLGIAPYMVSKIIVFGILALVQSASLVVISHLIEPFEQGVFLPVLLETYITLALAGLAGTMLGMVISAVAANEDMANSLLAVGIMPQVIFSGIVLPLKDDVTRVVAMIFPIRWGMIGLGSSLGVHSDKVGGDTLWSSDPVYHSTLYSIYSQADATQRIVLSWLAMGAIIIVLTCIVGIVMKRKDARK
ncbi:MAG TPA: FHA domain-containing protein [Ktedonobacterales bacterium]